jgi:NAD-dependent dihydropyrimidine dehydrogenase PreA subunit
MAKRKIIKIDEAKCNGCGLCIPNCPEGALQIIDKKARLVSDLFCDGLGACIGHCPRGAITIEEREAEVYNEKKVMKNIVKQGENVLKAHLEHLKAHNEEKYLKHAVDYLKEKGIKNPLVDLPCRCPGTAVKDFRKDSNSLPVASAPKAESQLRQWPVQLKLVPANASYLNGADLLIAADCVPFAYANFHQDLLKGKILLVGCPKLDDLEFYKEKISAILRNNVIISITYAHMEVPCCSGLIGVIKYAIDASGKNIPFKDITITIKGEKI